MESKFERLFEQIATLRKSYEELGDQLSEAARSIKESYHPVSLDLLDRTKIATEKFRDLYAQISVVAGDAGAPLSEADLLTASIDDIERRLTGAIQYQEVESVRRAALSVLDRIELLYYPEADSFEALSYCQRQAKALKERLLTPDSKLPKEALSLTDGDHPMAMLLALTENSEDIDDEEWEACQNGVEVAYGRELARAAMRGKLLFRKPKEKTDYVAPPLAESVDAILPGKLLKDYFKEPEAVQIDIEPSAPEATEVVVQPAPKEPDILAAPVTIPLAETPVEESIPPDAPILEQKPLTQPAIPASENGGAKSSPSLAHLASASETDAPAESLPADDVNYDLLSAEVAEEEADEETARPFLSSLTNASGLLDESEDDILGMEEDILRDLFPMDSKSAVSSPEVNPPTLARKPTDESPLQPAPEAKSEDSLNAFAPPAMNERVDAKRTSDEPEEEFVAPVTLATILDEDELEEAEDLEPTAPSSFATDAREEHEASSPPSTSPTSDSPLTTFAEEKPEETGIALETISEASPDSDATLAPAPDIDAEASESSEIEPILSASLQAEPDAEANAAPLASVQEEEREPVFQTVGFKSSVTAPVSEDEEEISDEENALGLQSDISEETDFMNVGNRLMVDYYPLDAEDESASGSKTTSGEAVRRSPFRTATGVDTIRRSPLTTEQEKILQESGSGVTVIFGCEAAGITEIDDYLKASYDHERYERLTLAMDQNEFAVHLQDSLKHDWPGLKIVAVEQGCPWDLRWLEEAIQQVSEISSSDNPARVVFTANPTMTWQFLMEKSSLRDYLTDFNALSLCLKPWTIEELTDWVQDASIVGEDRHAIGMISDATGNWPSILRSFYTFVDRDQQGWSDALTSLENQLREPIQARKLGKSFGLDRPVPQLILGNLAALGPLSLERLFSESNNVTEKVVRAAVTWGEMLNLVTKSNQDLWTLNPMVERVLKAIVR